MQTVTWCYNLKTSIWPLVRFFSGAILPSSQFSDFVSPEIEHSENAAPSDGQSSGVTWISTARPVSQVAPANYRDIRTFCWPGATRSFRRLFYTAYFFLDIDDDSFHLYKGNSSVDVQSQYKSSSRWFTLLPWRDHKIYLSAFTPTCMGVYTSKAYSVRLRIYRLDPSRVAMFMTGAILILFARKMSRNVVFHYSSGIAIALLGSLLVVVYLVSRMIPRKAAGATVFVGGSAVVLYIFRNLWENFRETIITHRNYVGIYVALVSIMTTLGIYRFGGVRNPRTMEILQWGLQGVGAALIYLGCTIEQFGLFFICFFLFLDVAIHSGYSLRRISWFNRLFPPKPPKLLTQEEYDEIGRRETVKELQKLRQFANSPECKSWSLVKKLRTPSRFGAFVEDGTHLSTDEVDAYDRELSFGGDDDEMQPAPPVTSPRSSLYPSLAPRPALGRESFFKMSAQRENHFTSPRNGFHDDSMDFE